jgi:cytochrome c oxidase cbb3-type subunit III
MLLSMHKKKKYILSLFASLLFMALQPAWAAGPPEPSVFSNPLAITLVLLMLLLLIIIGILANILIGAADVKLSKRKKEKKGQPVLQTLLITGLILLSASAFSQGTATEIPKEVAKTIGGMASSTFYVMATVIFMELFIIIALLINIKFLLKTEKEKIVAETEPAEAKNTRLSWWDRFNKLKPVSEEAELDLGHEYDGIRELNNRLPPWWLYGFYLSILFAVIYLWRFHVSHDGPSSKEEYENSVAKAELKTKEFLKSKGDAVDENTVTLLTSADDVTAGKAIFIKSCAVCHKESGAGLVGPNLTDDYWLHGNDLKSIFKIIRYGINAMPQWQNAYSNKQIAQVTSYIKTLHGTKPADPKAPEGVEMKEVPAPATRAADTSKSKDNKVAMNQ